MTPAEFAARLHGRQYREEITAAEVVEAEAAGLVVVFGASDDLMEFRGAIYEELCGYDGISARVCADGILSEWPEPSEKPLSERAAERYFKRKAAGFKTIEAVWCPKATEADTEPFASWAFKTAIPHAEFDVMEGGELYCRGIVFRLADAAGGAS